VTNGSPDEEPLAACRAVSVVYGSGDSAVRALDTVDLDVARVDSLALLGRSGSGKTTLLHVLGGLVEPTSGSAVRSGGIAYVFQGANLLPYFTAFENVAFAAEVAPDPSNGAHPPLELLELVGLAGKSDHLPSELSGGEAQRVAIARAIARGAELVLCDEPTGHLDSDTGERVLDLIDALQREFGFALVVATHDADVAARLDRAVELEDGTILSEESG
jgi:putative ABC transport system ATP-binding protein